MARPAWKPPVDGDLLIAAYNEGRSIARIDAEFGLNGQISGLRSWLIKNGVKMRPPGGPAQHFTMRGLDLPDEVIRRYQAGDSARDLLIDFDIPCTDVTLLKWLRARGVDTRRKPGPHAPKADRICESCSSNYRPTSARQRLCRVCAPDKSWATRYFRYGVTKPQFDAMLEAQGGRCGCCDNPLTEDLSRIAVDHCHTQGHTRALLCSLCNFGLGFVENDKWMGQAFKYIERHRR